MSDLLQLMIKLVLTAFFWGLEKMVLITILANNWFLFSTEQIRPSVNIIFKVGSVCSKGICFLNKLVIPESLSLCFMISLTL